MDILTLDNNQVQVQFSSVVGLNCFQAVDRCGDPLGPALELNRTYIQVFRYDIAYIFVRFNSRAGPRARPHRSTA